jgi:hypothetical protein
LSIYSAKSYGDNFTEICAADSNGGVPGQRAGSGQHLLNDRLVDGGRHVDTGLHLNRPQGPGLDDNHAYQNYQPDQKFQPEAGYFFTGFPRL